MRNSYLEIREEDYNFPIVCFKNDGSEVVFPHWHKEIEIVYVKRGTLNIGINDSILSMEAGEIGIISGGEVHYYLDSPDSERIVILFDISFFKDMRLIDKKEPSILQILKGLKRTSNDWPVSTTEKVQSILQTIYDEYSLQKQGYIYAIQSNMYDLILTLFRTVFTYDKSLNEESERAFNPKILTDQLIKIFEYVEEHYQEKVTLKDIADFMGFNTEYFSRYFKKLTGQTFITFLNDYRLNKAKWILLNEDLPVIEVANKAGFNSVKTFHHLFKEKFGTSPLKYKKSKSGNN